MGSINATTLLAGLLGVAAMVLLVPPLLAGLYRRMRHRRGRWLRRSIHRSHHRD